MVEGSAGGGAVKVRATGALEFQEVIIAPEVVDPPDVEMLQDLVLAAVRDVVDQVHAEAVQAFGGLQLGGLGGFWASRWGRSRRRRCVPLRAARRRPSGLVRSTGVQQAGSPPCQ